ncbi:MAG: SDR family NAD(P)-dependent oxidoreductase [Planctomycetaceae bacterium]
MRELRDRWALITGAAGGIGRALALSLAERGVHLWLADRDASVVRKLCQSAHQLGVEARPFFVDLRCGAEIDELAADISKSRYGVDILVNNAGLAQYGGTHQISDEQWDDVMAVNLLAPVRLTRRLLPLLRQRPEAHIINMCSISGLVAGGRFSAYHTSKFGLVGFSHALRAEYTRKGIGVTAVCPGPVRTELYKHCLTTTGEPAPAPPRWLSATPEQVAAATMRAIIKNKRQVLLTPMAHGLYQLQRFAPWVLDLVQTCSRHSLPWYRGKPLHVPTSFPVSPLFAEDEVDHPVALPFVNDNQTAVCDVDRRRAM